MKRARDATKRGRAGRRLGAALALLCVALGCAGVSWLARWCVGCLGIVVDPSAARASALQQLDSDRLRVERQLWDADTDLRIRIEVLERIVREDHDRGFVR